MTEPDQPSDGSDENLMYTAEYKDGQLHIVEVSPYEKESDADQTAYEVDGTLPEASNDDDDDGEHTKYLHLDLLNFTVLKNADGTNTYEMVSADGTDGNDDSTITCVLSNDDVDEDNTESYVMLETDNDQDPYMFLQSRESDKQNEPTTSVTADAHQPEPKPAPSKTSTKSKQLTPVQILEKAKALQKAKALTSLAPKRQRGRKKSDLPTPMELLSSPNFKLYLYSCKMCTFKCNAIKEMSQHKKAEHFNSVKAASARVALLQCARCPYRGHTHKQLLNHIEHSHKEPTVSNEYITALQLDSEEVEAADVLVCGACGFESGDRAIFRKHIEDEHGAITSLD